MLTHTMTHERMVREARKDLAGSRNACVAPIQRLRREQLLDPAADLLHLLPWESPRKNNWLVVLRMRYGLLYNSALAWFPDGRGGVAAVWAEQTGHAFVIDPEVFRSFGDHACPDETAVERVQSFFLENHTFQLTVDAPQGADTWSVAIATDRGLGTGIWDTRTDIIHWRTFVHHGQLLENQELSQEGMDWDRVLQDLSPGQRQHLIARAEKNDPEVAAFLKGRVGKAA